MARRNFIVELSDLTVNYAVTSLSKQPAEPDRLVRDAGYVQGLNAAKLLFEEIVRSENEKD